VVSEEEFLAFFAGASATIPDDGMFEAVLINCFHADDPTAPRLDSTARVWPAEGDPLATNATITSDCYASIHHQPKGRGYDASASYKSLYNKPEATLPTLVKSWETTSRRDFRPPTGEQLANATIGEKGKLPSPTGIPAVDRVRAKILERAGPDGFVGLQRAFRIMDKSRDQKLSKDEVQQGLQRLRVQVSPAELDTVWNYCNRDKTTPEVTVGELCRMVRGPITAKARLDILFEAFTRLDKSGDGVIALAELAPRYDCSRHPDVLAGRKTKDEVVQEFIADWDGNKDGTITLEEWLDYYGNISCTIDNDQYFELMIRNAWHIPGGKGWAENTANRRVLAKFADGRQKVVEIRDDLGLKADDVAEMKRRLMAQGYTGIVEIKLAM